MAGNDNNRDGCIVDEVGKDHGGGDMWEGRWCCGRWGGADWVCGRGSVLISRSWHITCVLY